MIIYLCFILMYLVFVATTAENDTANTKNSRVFVSIIMIAVTLLMIADQMYNLQS